jgi:serine palmitoyltransferase
MSTSRGSAWRAEYLGAEECSLYSDAVASLKSVIPAFAKKGDVIVVDDSCSFAIQQGCLLSRSNSSTTIDLADLERVLKGLAAKEKASGSSKILHRKFIVLEGVSAIDGSIAPMAAVVKLKDKVQIPL